MKKDVIKIAECIEKNSGEKALCDFLEGLLSPQEIAELAQRIEIVRLLKQGVSQHKIAKQLGVGVATVTRGSKELQKGRFKSI